MLAVRTATDLGSMYAMSRVCCMGQSVAQGLLSGELKAASGGSKRAGCHARTYIRPRAVRERARARKARAGCCAHLNALISERARARGSRNLKAPDAAALAAYLAMSVYAAVRAPALPLAAPLPLNRCAS